ncbi:MAG TPA: LysR family transcriptional regulator, partial [Candidatus Acidoferrum sp.]|nr:LysR family transcriptional regulator [Candidatus Acidoferrum sp.]
LSLTHPAVTLQIKAMESDLGVRLFDCAGEKVSLTRQGSVLLTHANEVAAMVSEATGNTVLAAKKGEALAAGLTFVLRHFTAAPGQQAILQNCSALRPHREQRSGSNGGVMQ